MPELPAKLPVGIISIYGGGSINGIFDGGNGGDSKFGVVVQTYTPFCSVSVGQSVYYKKEDIISVVTYNNDRYSLIKEQNLLMTENPYVPAP